MTSKFASIVISSIQHQARPVEFQSANRNPSVGRAVKPIAKTERVGIRKSERPAHATGGEADVRPLDEIGCGLHAVNYSIAPRTGQCECAVGVTLARQRRSRSAAGTNKGHIVSTTARVVDAEGLAADIYNGVFG